MGSAKLIALQIAAILTQAAMAARGGAGAAAATIDPTNADPTQRGLNLQAWEVFRGYYTAILQVLANDTAWPSPKDTSPGVPPGLLTTLAQPAIAALIGSNPTLAPLAAALKGFINLPTTPATPLPAPGAAVAPEVATK